MTEQKHGITYPESVRQTPDDISRRLLVVKGRAGLQLQDFNESLVRNQAKFGRGTDDYVAMAEVHEYNADGEIMGIHEEVRKRFIINVDGVNTEFVEANPKVRNIWVGKYVKLLTPEEAAKTEYAGQTALKWATVNNKSPEMVVRARNGYFYPATKKDLVISSTRL